MYIVPISIIYFSESHSNDPMHYRVCSCFLLASASHSLPSSLPTVRVQSLPNAFQAAGGSGVREKTRGKKKEAEKEDSRKRKRSALEQIRDVRTAHNTGAQFVDY